PADTGDTPVIAYQVTVSDGRTITVTGRDAIVTQPTIKAMTRTLDGLAPATTYTFTIAAVTATGVGAPVTVTAKTL
ncbi:fibronectin type III domain-containing protein, partial [Kibdelosporangium lantanae]